MDLITTYLYRLGFSNLFYFYNMGLGNAVDTNIRRLQSEPEISPLYRKEYSSKIDLYHFPCGSHVLGEFTSIFYG